MRVQILGKENLLSLNETLAIVRAEEGRRGVMLETPMIENLALMTRRMNPQHSNSEQHGGEAKRTPDGSRSNKDLLWCTYCKKPRHTIDKCWKLHGKPQVENKGTLGKQKRKEHAYVANTQQSGEGDSP